MALRLLLAVACTLALNAAACGKTRNSRPSPDALPFEDAAGRNDATHGDGSVDGGPMLDPACVEMHRRADEATPAMLFLHWSPDALVLSDQGRSTTPTSLSGVGHMMAAIADAVERTEGVRYYGWLDVLYDWQTDRRWTSSSYEHLGDAAYGLLRAHEVLGKQRYLDRAIEVAERLSDAWSTMCCGETGGGLWSSTSRAAKSTRVNATAVIVFATIYERTKDEDALAFARMVYDYWLDTMVDPETHEVFEGIDQDGDIGGNDFTGDQGLMVGASVSLYRATGDEVYLAHAHDLAEFLVTDLVNASGILTDGDENLCIADCPLGKGLAFRWLLALQEEDPRDVYDEVLSDSVEALYTYAWEYGGMDGPREFAVDWSVPFEPTGNSDLRKNAAALTALNLSGRLLGDCGYLHPRDVYEAEDASFIGLVPENVHLGYTGWGLLGYFVEDDDEVTFTINVASDGYYRLRFRYAAATGDADRTLLVDGNEFNASLSFEGTFSWRDYRTVEVDVSRLEAGTHEITLRMVLSNGNSSYVNVDSLTILPAEG